MNIGDCVAFEKAVLKSLIEDQGMMPENAKNLVRDKSTLICQKWATGDYSPNQAARWVAID